MKRAVQFFQQWFRAARRSKLEPIKQTALTLQAHLFGLLNYFVHPITNAISEGFNSKIQAIKAYRQNTGADLKEARDAVERLA